MKKIGRVINEYIIESWMTDYKHLDGTYKFTEFARDHYIEEKIARKIVKEENYMMTIETLHKICDSRNITLADFFKAVGF